MIESSRYHLIGLWRVWERLDGANDPHGDAPDALLERLAGIFAHGPDDCERDAAMQATDLLVGNDAAWAHREPVASVVVGEPGWEAMRKRSAWADDASCRHAPGSPTLATLHVYGIEEQSLGSPRGRLWVPAVRDPRSFEAIVERARAASAAAGVPEYETFGEAVPFFIRPEVERPPRRSRPRRRDGGGPG